MKALIVYESMFGNTREIAEAIAEELSDVYEVSLAGVSGRPAVDGAHLMVVGGPTHAFGMSRPATRQDATRQGSVPPAAMAVGLREYLDGSPPLPGVPAAVFDTKAAKGLVTGSAARKAHRVLRGLGCRMLLPAESFLVGGMTGPLIDGEVQRARRWARSLAALAKLPA